MSEPIYVRGWIRDVKYGLERMREVLRNREALGWRVLQSDEDWMFMTERDLKVCRRCLGFEGTVHKGDLIYQHFPFFSFIDWRHIKANIHENCRCTLEFVGAIEVYRKRIRKELMMTV